MKKLVSLLVILCLICSMVPFILASADLNGTMGSWDFSASAEFITIEKYNGSEMSVIVPDRINGNEVVAIASNAFSENKKIKSVKIPDTVSYIYDNAFYGCESLATIEAHNYMYVGKQAFEGTAFYNDESNWKNGVLYFYDLILKAKTDIKTVSIDKDAHSICAEAFKDCAYLTSVTIPSTISSIDENAFDGCSRLSEVVFERNSADTDYQIVISDYAFLNCSSLKSVKLPENVANVATYAFGFSSEDTEYVKSNDFTIYGVMGTPAQDYAEL
ncbi:MAG: leucine-rich repeat domain-containing protein, partial [Clostridia bacterium]|nr:leucine-rich repeat domain-containing protein [Clostridia bacterium]